MNATCAAQSAADDDDDDDEDGEAVDMEGEAQLCVSCLQDKTRGAAFTPFTPLLFLPQCLLQSTRRAACWTRTRSPTHVDSLTFFASLWRRPPPAGVRARSPDACSQIVCRPPWTPARWWKPKPKLSPGARTPSSRPGHTTCTSPTTNTTRPPDCGCLDTTKYVRRVKVGAIVIRREKTTQKT